MTAEQHKWLKRHRGHVQVTAARHHHDYATAANGEGPWMFDRVLCGDGSLLPGDSFCLGVRIYVRPLARERLRLKGASCSS